MANKNTRARNKQLHKDKKHYHGKACPTAFGTNPESKKKSRWKGAGKASSYKANIDDLA
jgi:hypothetical protein